MIKPVINCKGNNIKYIQKANMQSNTISFIDIRY